MRFNEGKRVIMTIWVMVRVRVRVWVWPVHLKSEIRAKGTEVGLSLELGLGPQT